jgi:frataxin-like iron-binding protein CyaY
MTSKRLLLFLFFFLFLSCQDNRWKYNQTKNINKHTITYIDFDYVLYNFSSPNLKHCISKNYNQNEILGYLFLQCLSLGNPEDSLFFRSVDLFRNDKYIKLLENEIDISLRKNLSIYEQNLNLKFQKLGYFIKNKTLPKKIFWLNTLFSSSVFCSQNEIGVGLERYVGTNKTVINKLPTEQFFQWMKDGMRQEFLERDVLVNWIYTHYVPDNAGSLIEKMIQWGKVYYILHAIDPDLPEHIVLRYQKQKYNWCLNNEDKVWKYIVSQSLVFSKNERDISNFINDGPFTPGLPEKGPDRLGQYIGFKMVSNFMDNHENKSLNDLLNTPYNTILQEYQID